MVRVKDPISGGTHLLAAVLAGFGLLVLLKQAAAQASSAQLVTFSIFGVSLVLLYCASSVHHLIPKSRRLAKLYRRIDHAMIFVLIAGTYTPICVIALGGMLGWGLTITVWMIAVFGVWLKLSGRHVTRYVSTGLYVGMGWIAVVAAYPLLEKLSTEGFIWLLAGGLSYTAGGAIFALRRPNPYARVFGHHEIFHLFVMVGSFCHFWTILKFVR